MQGSAGWARGWAARVTGAVLLVIMGMGGGRAAAHPFDVDLYGQQVTVSVGEDDVVMDILAEVPTRVVLADAAVQLAGAARPTPAQRAAFLERWLTELRDGYRLFLNGASVPLSALPVEGENGVGDAKFINYRLRLRAPLGREGVQQINLIDDNFPDQRAVRSVLLRLRPAWRLDASTLVRWDADGALIDRSGAWSALEADRELRLSVQPRAAWRWTAAGLGWRLGAAGQPDPEGWLAGRDALVRADGPAVQRGAAAGSAGALLGLALLGGIFNAWRARAR